MRPCVRYLTPPPSVGVAGLACVCGLCVGVVCARDCSMPAPFNLKDTAAKLRALPFFGERTFTWMCVCVCVCGLGCGRGPGVGQGGPAPCGPPGRLAVHCRVCIAGVVVVVLAGCGCQV